MTNDYLEINILTIFSNMFKGPFSESILKRAQEKGLIKINIVDLRDFATDKHKTVDDYSYGGGPGMVLKPQPIWDAVEMINPKKSLLPLKIIITSAQGKIFSQEMAKDLSKEKRLLFICGRYEGIDERIPQLLDAEEVSVGNFVVSGGELPAMLMVDVISRMIPDRK
ncbi:MAG: tRNA (guanosine(37)-N1)-methyltransferase TrmD, partial [Atribacterota bacterium]|nr:tRNA (guanosine(37)-N1)-methyltransferase TrmD [Atribacterota bacterium]